MYTITEIKRILDQEGAPHPAFLFDDGTFETWDFEGLSYFRWSDPSPIPLPAVIYGPQGFYRVDRADLVGSFVKGACTKMTAGYWLSSYLIFDCQMHEKGKKKFPRPRELDRPLVTAEDYCLSFGGRVVT